MAQASDFIQSTQDSEALSIQKLLRLTAADFGLLGKLVITDTSAHTPAGVSKAWVKLHALVDTVVAASADSGADTLAGQTIKAGDEVYGFFTSITLTSGKLIAYNL